MSDNKYIIDKDSLTGIADAVRNKLGESTSYSIDDIQDKITNYWSIPEGSLNISANGTYDVTTKASAIVNVPNPSTGSLEITENGTYDVTDKASAIVNVPSGGGGGTLETWKWSNTQSTYLTFPSDFSVENLKDIICLSGDYPRGLYKDSLGKPVSMKDQEISLPSSRFTIGSPLTGAKISAAHNEGRTFCIPWNWTGVKRIPNDVTFVWFVVEPNDSKIYLGAGYYVNYVGNGKWTVIYT